jgi:hypothetical protein
VIIISRRILTRASNAAFGVQLSICMELELGDTCPRVTLVPATVLSRMATSAFLFNAGNLRFSQITRARQTTGRDWSPRNASRCVRLDWWMWLAGPRLRWRKADVLQTFAGPG